VRIEVKNEAELITRQADEDMLYRAFLNIQLNAIQAMKEGGLLTVATGLNEDGQVVISFTDTGAGISEENIARIFEPFYTDKSKGTGLGLAIVKNIIEQHGGEIIAESTEKEGARFTIIFL